jgi:uncharacterized protein YndB with AHSA1/START domain
MAMDPPRIIHVAYIAATPRALWDALTNPEITQRYWGGTRLESDWKVGSTLRYRRDGAVTDEHTILAVEPQRYLSHTFHPVFTDEFRAEPPSRVTFTLERGGAVVRLTLLHDGFRPGSNVFVACSEGWPMVLSNLKTLLETGRALPPFKFSGKTDRLQQAYGG